MLDLSQCRIFVEPLPLSGVLLLKCTFNIGIRNREELISESGIDLLQCAEMASIRLLAAQNGIAALHPSQSSMRP